MSDARIVVVTGGASGMGEASARLFTEQGDTVVIVDVDEVGAQRVAAEIGAPSPWIGDLSDATFCVETVDGIAGIHGGIDVLVNAAGTIHRSDAVGTGNDDWRRVMGVNIDAVFYLSRTAIPYLVARQGSIVNFGSIWGNVGSKGATAYCVSKGAVHQLTRAMALDHVEDGVRVNAVAPGEVRTPMLSSQRDRPPTEADLQAIADATIPMKRLADPEEIARVVVFLASDAASYITGEIVSVDGGYSAR